jgi:hypothetical protein
MKSAIMLKLNEVEKRRNCWWKGNRWRWSVQWFAIGSSLASPLARGGGFPFPDMKNMLEPSRIAVGVPGNLLVLQSREDGLAE